MDQVEEIKRKTDMVALVGEYVDLKKSGRNFKGLCPFHGEKTPSFMVNEELQIYKCFGCGKGGDALSFLQEIEGLDFVEALEKLADRAGIKLKREGFKKDRGEKERLLEAHALAAEYYHYLLAEHRVGAVGREYLEGRGIKKKIWDSFKLGFAPNEWDSLTRYLREKKGFKDEEMVKAGVAIEGKGGRVYDRFRGRVMFALQDSGGKTVGFSGRVIPVFASDKEPKYINSPETTIYHKSQMLYGLVQAKQAIRETKEAVVVEGELDMISSFVAGVTETVAIKGSALTEEMVEKLARLAETLVLALDADEAGEEALKRSVEIAEKRGMQVKAVYWQEGKDPDEIARKSAHEWKRLVKEAMPVYEWVMKRALQKWGTETAEAVGRVVKAVVPYLAKIENQVVAEVWSKRLAEELGVSKERVWEEVEKAKKKAGVGEEKEEVKEEKEEEGERAIKLGRRLIRVLMTAEEEDREFLKKVLSGIEVKGVEGKLLKRLLSEEELEVVEWVKSLPEELKEVAELCYLDEDQDELSKERIARMGIDLAREVLKKQRTELVEKMKVAEKSKDRGKLKELMDEVDKVDDKERKMLSWL